MVMTTYRLPLFGKIWLKDVLDSVGGGGDGKPGNAQGQVLT